MLKIETIILINFIVIISICLPRFGARNKVSYWFSKNGIQI